MGKWHCETIPEDELPFSVSAFCKRINGSAIRVPVRLRGLTSSGRLGGCYYNVNIATKLFGGSSLVGWVVAPPNSTLPSHVKAKLIGHAVWLNPQNRASCITAKSWGLEHVHEKNGRQYIDMIIWKEVPSSSPFTLHDLLCVRDSVRRKNLIVWFDRNGPQSISMDLMNSMKAESQLANVNNNRNEQDFETRTKRSHSPEVALMKLIQAYEEVGGFSEPSVATGKSYEEIKNERISRLK